MNQRGEQMREECGKKTKKLEFPKSITEWAIFLVILAFFAIRNITVLFYGVQCLFIVVMINYFIKNKVNTTYSIVSLFFLLWTILSFLWADSESNAYKFGREVSQILIITVLLSFYCNNVQKIKKVLEYIAIATAIMVIYLIICTPVNEWIDIYNYTENVADDEGRLGRTIGLHPNQMGILCAISCLVWFYIWKTKKNKFSILWIFLFLILILFTKSRTAMLSTFSFLFLYWILEKPNAKSIICKILVSVFLIFLMFLMILKIPVLYNLIGFRFEGMLGIFRSSTVVDASTLGREKLIKTGLDIIQDYTILGVGAGNYANEAYNNYGIWREVYAHSNFIEIFADLGLIGFVIYYLPRIWCCYWLTKNVNRLCGSEKTICALLASFMISSIIFDYLKISYNNEPEQIMYTLAFCFSIMINSKMLNNSCSNEVTEIEN